jgi:hypothetical protein
MVTITGRQHIFMQAGSHSFHSLISNYVTGTDRRSTVLSRDADFLRDKTSLTSEVPCFSSNISTMSSSNIY